MDDVDLEQVSLTDQIEYLIEDLPVPVQKFIRSARRDEISMRLSQKYGLHADTAGAFERAYIFMLLGVFTPDEFVQELRDEGIEESVIKGLAADINDEVFKKLRAEEQGTPVPAKAEYRAAPPPPAPSVPPMHVGMGTEKTPLYSHPSELVSHQNTPMPGTAHPAYSLSPTQPATGPAPSEPYLPYARTMAEDMERAAHGLTGQPATPARSFQTASVPITFAQPRTVPNDTAYIGAPASSTSAPTPQFSAPHESEPIAAPNYATPAPAPTQASAPVMAPVRLTPVDRPHNQNAPITKEFGSDPYREPITA